MKITEITEGKKNYLDLLLLADEQEDMIDRYLDRGRMFVMTREGETANEPEAVLAECVVTREGDGIFEIKNLAVAPWAQKQGIGRSMTEAVFELFPDCRVLYVGTGESPATLGFYEKCGFTVSHRIKDFFTKHYDHPIYEEGVLLRDMICLKKERKRERGKE